MEPSRPAEKLTCCTWNTFVHLQPVGNELIFVRLTTNINWMPSNCLQFHVLQPEDREDPTMLDLLPILRLYMSPVVSHFSPQLCLSFLFIHHTYSHTIWCKVNEIFNPFPKFWLHFPIQAKTVAANDIFLLNLYNRESKLTRITISYICLVSLFIFSYKVRLYFQLHGYKM